MTTPAQFQRAVETTARKVELAKDHLRSVERRLKDARLAGHGKKVTQCLDAQRKAKEDLSAARKAHNSALTAQRVDLRSRATKEERDRLTAERKAARANGAPRPKQPPQPRCLECNHTRSFHNSRQGDKCMVVGCECEQWRDTGKPSKRVLEALARKGKTAAA